MTTLVGLRVPLTVIVALTASVPAENTALVSDQALVAPVPAEFAFQ